MMQHVFTQSVGNDSIEAQADQLREDNRLASPTPILDVSLYSVPHPRMSVKNGKVYYRDDVLNKEVFVGRTDALPASEYFKAACTIDHSAEHSGEVDLSQPSEVALPRRKRARVGAPACSSFLKHVYGGGKSDAALRNWLCIGYERGLSSAEHIALGKQLMPLLHHDFERSCSGGAASSSA